VECGVSVESVWSLSGVIQREFFERRRESDFMYRDLSYH